MQRQNLAKQPAHSGLLARTGKISVRTRMRGGGCSPARAGEPRSLNSRYAAAPEPRFEPAATAQQGRACGAGAGPFGWQVGQAGNSHAMREPPVDGGPDEIGREKGKRDCHIHLADAAPLPLGDSFRGCRFLGDKFIEPPAPAGDRCDQGGAIFRTQRPGGLRQHSIRDKNRTAPP